MSTNACEAARPSAAKQTADQANAFLFWLLDSVLPPQLQVVGTYETGIFDESAAEIVSFDAKSRRLFVVNGSEEHVDVLSFPEMESQGTLDVSAFGSPTSVDTWDGLLAVAVVADEKTDPGHVVFFDAETLAQIDSVQTGALPDMVTFTPNGKYVLTANEGEPNADYSIDPEGSISIIRVANRNVRNATFNAFNSQKAQLIASGVRIFGPESTVDEPDDIATVAQDLEPEYIAIAPDSLTAWVTLQENNAIAVVDILTATVRSVRPLGYKDHSLPGNELDASDRDDVINIASWPVMGMYLPDAVSAFEAIGGTYLITVNEGDAREYDTFVEQERIKDLVLDESLLAINADLQEDELIGRLNVTTTMGDIDGDQDFDVLYSFGARSFTIWKPTVTGHILPVYDSGSQIEQRVAADFPAFFNSNNDDNDSFDARSDDKGPEPEAVTTGQISSQTYAFVGLERMGGIMVVNVSNPFLPRIVSYALNRNFGADAESSEAGDLGPEGVEFISPEKSGSFFSYLAVANEVSGTTTLYRVTRFPGLFE